MPSAQGGEGVEGVELMLEPGGATVTGNPDIAQLIIAINDAGYQAHLK